MELRKLGNSELKVSPLCFGGNVFGWTADERTSFQLLDTFVDLGFNFIDTADVYSTWVPGNKGGESEEIIGRWLKNRGRRDDVIIATKVGAEMTPTEKGLSKAYIAKAVEDSLRRLQTDYIDLYQSHYDDTSLAVEEPLEAYATLISEGKVRVIGASNFSPERLREALDASDKGLPRYESLQPQYNLVAREEYEKDLQAIAAEYQIGVITYYSLASGFLSGKYRSEEDFNKGDRGRGAKRHMHERGLAILAALDEIAARRNATQAQVSLAWLIAQPTITSPIVSATSVDQLTDIAKAADLRLEEADIEQLNKASNWK